MVCIRLVGGTISLKSNYIDFQGILLQKTEINEDGYVRMTFLTRKGEETIVAHNPRLTPSLLIGANYQIKGRENTTDGETYIRLMSARPLVPRPILATHRKKLATGSVSFAVLAALATVLVVPPSAQLSVEDTKSYENTVPQEGGTHLQGPLDGVTQGFATEKQAEPSAPAATPPQPASSDKTPAVPQEAQQYAPTAPVASAPASPTEGWDTSADTMSSSDRSATYVQPATTLQPNDSSLRPTFDQAPTQPTDG